MKILSNARVEVNKAKIGGLGCWLYACPTGQKRVLFWTISNLDQLSSRRQFAEGSWGWEGARDKKTGDK